MAINRFGGLRSDIAQRMLDGASLLKVQLWRDADTGDIAGDFQVEGTFIEDDAERGGLGELLQLINEFAKRREGGDHACS